MKKRFFSWLLYGLCGWKREITVSFPDKFIVALAPHTSNWDFVLGQLFCLAEGVRIGFLMKKEWFFWPLGPLFRSIGGIPVFRQKHSSMTDAVADAAIRADRFALCITPEGTRKPVEEWKKGFYFIALKSGIPILLFSADYEKKLIRCTKEFRPTGDVEKDLIEIRSYYKGVKGKKPNNFIDICSSSPLRPFCITILGLLLLASCSSHRDVLVSKYKGYPQYIGKAWVSNTSKPINISKGMDNKHVAVWASHGAYYNQSKGKWEWQRPICNGTREDYFTRTVVVPYLIPMLENAGANVFTPRERDEQTNEVIVDGGKEYNLLASWENCPSAGFANTKKVYNDNDHPFLSGGTRMAKASKSPKCEVQYIPQIPAAGRYAVYVSYPEYHGKNVPDAHYTVCHGGVRTEFRVNQRMGQGTWVYLGTFHFEVGAPERNRVILTNQSQSKGFVTADAVRFGGGMGNIERGGKVSGHPRYLEAARYTAQWYGAPDSVWTRFNHKDDYKDDINVRPRMVNWLAGGSCFNPNEGGLNVPIELSLAVHSDAGVTRDSSSYIGSLAICTTDHNNGRLGSGASRSLSAQFARELHDNIYIDVCNEIGRWNVRGVLDKNYGETRIPQVPSAIIEMLSHENYADMQLGHDERFRFTVARSLYKTIARFIAQRHGLNAVIAPLPPRQLQAFQLSDGRVQLQWIYEEDKSEASSSPDGYIVYKAEGTGDYDNGTVVKGTAVAMKIDSRKTYRFKVTAYNKGGESLAAEIDSI